MSKVVVARYITEEVFKIPKSLDLEDKSKVEEWWVKYNRLHIRTTDGRHLSINGEGCVDSFDYKHPSSIINGVEGVSIESAEDYGYEEEEPDIEPELYDTVMERLIQFPKLDYIKKEDEESEGEKTEPEKWDIKDLIPNEEVKCDDMGVAVQYNEETEGWDALEPYCVECGKPESEVEVNYFTIENEVFICCECNEKKEEENLQPFYQRKFPTKERTRTEAGRKTEFLKHIKTLLNINSSNGVYNVDWDCDDKLYFDTKNPDCRSIKVHYVLRQHKLPYKNKSIFWFEFEVMHKARGSNEDWILL